MRVLVVGGAGYIGSHMCKLLVEQGFEVIVLDNLSTGFRKNAKYGLLYTCDLSSMNDLEILFSQHQFDAVMHFAANSLVGESILQPAKYYRNNVIGTLNLLDVMVRHDVKAFVFSSTAAVFGEPLYTPIDEAHPQIPINPYGRSKLIVENILQDYASAYELSSICLRYFNAAGADPQTELGECHDPETHLIPLVLQTATGRRQLVTVFGTDYPTTDGTCIRDYVHVMDLCSAHLKALRFLGEESSGAYRFNLGNGKGYSIQEVLDSVSRIVAPYGKDIKVKYGERRKGDPSKLVADSKLAKEKLGWTPKYHHLDQIIEHAWLWELKSINEGIKA